jgi:hypothetical protein
MAKKQLTLSISTPCKEDWNTMTPDKNGKFCASCQKIVVDFSRLSDTEIIHYFDNFKVPTCGRFSEKQLNTPITEMVMAQPQNRWAWALSALLLPTIAASQTIKATEAPPSVFEQKITEKGLLIEGEVAELGSHSPILNAVILIVINEKIVAITSSDSKGLFKINLPLAFDNQSFTMIFESKNREKQSLFFNNYAAILDSLLFISMEKIAEDKRFFKLKGKILNEHNEVLIGASIVVKGTTKGAVSDLDGHFELSCLSEEITTQDVGIVVSFVGYQTKEFTLSASKTNMDMTIVLDESTLVLGGYEYIVAPRSFFQRTKYRVKKIFRQIFWN